MSEELGECPNNTENTVCLSPLCKYKHDRVWPIPPAIQEAMNRELDEEVFYAERVNTPPPREWTPEHEISFESYVNRMLNYPSKCPCGCGILLLPKKKETDDAQDNDEAKKETDDAQGNDEE